MPLYEPGTLYSRRMKWMWMIQLRLSSEGSSGAFLGRCFPLQQAKTSTSTNYIIEGSKELITILFEKTSQLKNFKTTKKNVVDLSLGFSSICIISPFLLYSDK
jgi:hypothetical protein